MREQRAQRREREAEGLTRDLILSAARGARMAGATQMIVVSAVGASAKSRNFYLRTKGETEDGLRALETATKITQMVQDGARP